MEQPGLATNRRQVRGQLHLDADAFADHSFEQRDRVDHHVIEIDRGDVDFALSREGEELASQGSRAFACSANVVGEIG